MFKYNKGDKLVAKHENVRRPLIKIKAQMPESDEYMVWDRRYRFPLGRIYVEENYAIYINAPGF